LSKTHVATGTQAYLKTMIIINIEQTNTQNNYKFMVLKTCINTTQIPNTDKTYKLQCADAILKVHFNWLVDQSGLAGIFVAYSACT